MLNKIRQTKLKELATIGSYDVPRHTGPSLRDTLLQSKRIEVIAEIKRASPSRGIICETLHVEKQVEAYERGGACAISVLTDETYFSGSNHDLQRAAAVTRLPILAKDFFISEKQVERARFYGATVILIIARFVTDDEAFRLIQRAKQLQMDILIEVHTKDELERMRPYAEDVIYGINNRDLSTFTVDFEPTNRLSEHMPRPYISESGFRTKEDVLSLSTRPDGLLIGSAFMLSESPEQLLPTFRILKEDE